MKIKLNNATGRLNGYFFQSLCLFYFPNEKFPENDPSPNSAVFNIIEGEEGFEASAEFFTPQGSSKGECREKDISFTVPVNREEICAAVTGKAFLECGRKMFGFVPPWGLLTGLRPVKRARFYLEKGYSPKEVEKLFTNDYSVSAAKATLSVSTAEREISMLSGLDSDICGIYVSIPFCPTRCDYCSFVSYANKKLFDLIPAYLKRLCLDIEKTGRMVKECRKTPVAVYIGGGTPTILEPNQLEILLDTISKSIDLSHVKEFSLEGGRPDTITREKLQVLRRFGVNRISINPQTTSDRVLEAVGRKHTAACFFEAAALAGGMGFDVINADLIAGLPTDDFETFKKSLSDVITFGFNNITVHTLSIKNAAEMMQDQNRFDPVGSLAARCVSYAESALAEHGLYPYYLYRQKRTVGNGENTGYAAPGKENLYNVLMMEEYSSVFACGAGAITKLVSADKVNIDRIAFAKYPFEYLEDTNGIREERIREFFKTNA